MAAVSQMPTRVLLCAGTTGQYLAHSDDNVLELHPHTGDVSPTCSSICTILSAS